MQRVECIGEYRGGLSAQVSVRQERLSWDPPVILEQVFITLCCLVLLLNFMFTSQQIMTKVKISLRWKVM